MKKPKTPEAYEELLAVIEPVVEAEERFEPAILFGLDAEDENDPFVTPWRRGYAVTVQSFLGH